MGVRYLMMDLEHWLKRLNQSNAIRALDYQFARFIASKAEQYHQAIGWLAARISYELGQGHICLPLVDAAGQFDSSALFFDPSHMSSLRSVIEAVDWSSVLHSSAVIGQPMENKPLIFDGQRLYLQRYWFYEHALAEQLKAFSDVDLLDGDNVQALRHWLNSLFVRDDAFLLAQWPGVASLSTDVQRAKIGEWLDIVAGQSLEWPRIIQCFQHAKMPGDLAELDTLVPQSACLNGQKLAAAVALTQRFSVISGGPGTGKTTTVAKLLAVLLSCSPPKGALPVIKLVAPTGKAAARLTESIGRAVASLPLTPELKQAMPTHAGTIHRLLGVLPDSAEFRHNAENPLHLDVLIVDEASMIDLSLMYKLISALPSRARLILLGDKDQLASVDAGAVLGDICSFARNRFGHQQAKQLAILTGFDQTNLVSPSAVPSIANCVCTLQKSYRFNAFSGIGQLARAVNAGNLADVDTVLHQAFSDIAYHEMDSHSYNQMLTLAVQEYRRYLTIVHDDSSPDTESKATLALTAFNRCRLLCAVREGDFGVEGINRRIERALSQRNLIPKEHESWYVGKPIMITRNDHALGIYNGDIGLCLLDEGKRFKVYFEMPDGTVKGVLPSRLPESETAYAMTIHKSQGSEFDITMMVLPVDYSTLLTRELVYTGITRAKHQLHLFANFAVFRRAVNTKTERASGLVEQLVE